VEQVVNACGPDLDFLAKWYDPELRKTLDGLVNASFERITYTEAIALLQKSGKNFEFPTEWGVDMQSEHERYLTEEVFQKPVIVTGYPKDIKAFYMRGNEDGKTVAAMDVLAPRIGEIIGGSQVKRHDVLLQRIRDMAAHGLKRGTGGTWICAGSAAYPWGSVWVSAHADVPDRMKNNPTSSLPGDAGQRGL
jgi:asparaginyl-tRNA synthetase